MAIPTSLTDPCGNVIPLPGIPAFPPIPSLADLLALLLKLLGLPPFPVLEFRTPCPLLAEAAEAAALSAAGV